MSNPEIRFDATRYDATWAWTSPRMPDLLVSSDVIQALREQSEPHSPNPCYRSFSIDEHSGLPSGTILGCTERGREFVREMKEGTRPTYARYGARVTFPYLYTKKAGAWKRANGREWMWRSLYGALAGGDT